MREILITSSALILIIALLRTLLKGKISLRLQYALWLLVALRLLIPVSFFQSPVSVLNAVEPVRSVISAAAPRAPAEPGTAGNTQGGQGGVAAGGTVAAPNVTAPAAPAPQGLDLAALIPGVWLAGMCGMGVWFLVSDLLFRRKLGRSAKRLQGMDCPLPVCVTAAVPSPCLYGIFRPAIYLTPDCLENEKALRHVLAHEETHYRHLDHIWSMVRCVCLAVYWFNPLVWLAAALSRRDCELACDEGAIRRLGEVERISYGRTLLSMVVPKNNPADLLRTATTMTSGKGGLKERIALIAKRPKAAVVTVVAVVLIAAVAVGCTFTGAQGPDIPPEEPRIKLTMDEGATAVDFGTVGFRVEGLCDYDGRSADLTGMPLPEDPYMITFDDRTKWPDTLPDGFRPNEIMEANKNPGLGVRALHERGITGKGVNLGIIDQSLLLEHEEYKDNLCYYRQLFKGPNGASMHGPAVASIAVGQSVGVAPDANLYYVSMRFPGPNEDEMSIKPFIEALNVMLDMNDTLPEGNKLDVISISRGFNETDEDWEQMKAALDRAEKAGVFVITVSTRLTHNMPIAGTSRVALSDCDDEENVRPGLFYEEYFYKSPSSYTDCLFVPMDFRTAASPTGVGDYANYTVGGMSWAVPYFAGVYCLAKQVKPDITPQEFWDKAMGTANAVSFEYNGQGYRLEHVINPSGIVAALGGG